MSMVFAVAFPYDLYYIVDFPSLSSFLSGFWKGVEFRHMLFLHQLRWSSRLLPFVLLMCIALIFAVINHPKSVLASLHFLLHCSHADLIMPFPLIKTVKWFSIALLKRPNILIQPNSILTGSGLLFHVSLNFQASSHINVLRPWWSHPFFPNGTHADAISSAYYCFSS